MQVNTKPIPQSRSLCLRSVFTRFLMSLALIVSGPVGVYAADLGLIDAAALKGNTSKWVILDARPRADWAAGHIPGSHPVFMGELYPHRRQGGNVQLLSTPGTGRGPGRAGD